MMRATNSLAKSVAATAYTEGTGSYFKVIIILKIKPVLAVID